MNRRQLTGLWVALVGGLLLIAGQNAAWGAHELLYAVTTRNDVISFYSDAPATILQAHAITGLQSSERICGIDWWGGQLYGLGNSSRLYTIDPNTGAATQVGGGQFATLLNGLSFGVDNNAGGVRVVSDLRQSLLVDRTTGAVISNDPALAYASGDPHVGQTPHITALAFDAASGQWYAGDSLANSFAVLVPATGALNTRGSAGIDFPRENGLDISATSGIMYLASPAASSDPQANLYTVNKTTGAVTLVGQIGNPGDNILMRGLTVAAACTPPLATTDTMGTVQGIPANAPVFKLVANDSSPVGGPLSITAVGSPSTQGGTVALISGGTLVAYTPPPGFVGVDQFPYTLSDTHCTAQGTVQVIVTSVNAPSFNNISLTHNPGANFLEFAGIPGAIYVIQSAPSATGPWTDLSGPLTANATGLITYNDVSPPPTRFYRTRVGP